MDETLRTLAADDPAASVRSTALDDRARRDLHAIMLPRRSGTGRRRFAVAAGTAAVLVAVVAAVLVARPTAVSYAATPPLLAFDVHGAGAPAAQRLRDLADRAERQPAEPGAYAYNKSLDWDMADGTDGPPRGAVVPEVYESWLGDRLMTTCRRAGKPMVARPEPEPADARRSAAVTPTRCERYPRESDERDNRQLGRHPAALTHRLRTTGTGPRADRILEAVSDTLTSDAQTPAYAATALRTLATAPDVRYRGVVRDRLGRPAAAFTALIDDSRARRLRVLLVDPGTGLITGDEEIVLKAGRYRPGVPLPAVTGYSAVVRQGYVDRVGARP